MAILKNIYVEHAKDTKYKIRFLWDNSSYNNEQKQSKSLIKRQILRSMKALEKSKYFQTDFLANR